MQAPEFPVSLAYVWQWFIGLHNARGSSGFGANPITWPDMAAFFGLHRIRPSTFELDLIKRLDSVAMKSMHEKPEEKQAEGPKLKPGKPHLRKKRTTK